MKRNILSSLVLALITISIYAQDPNILWQRTIGGSGEDNLHTMITTTDGGCLVGGHSNSNISGEKSENSKGGDDYWVVKLNTEGNIEWQKTIGGNDDDNLYSVIQAQDGGFLLGGLSKSGISGDKSELSRGGFDYWVMKLDSSGEIEWQKTLGGTSNDVLGSIIQNADGTYILGGYSSSGISGDRTVSASGDPDVWILKIDTVGNIIWQKAYGYLGNGQTLHTLIATSDGGYIFSSTLNGTNFWVTKINSNGTLLWDKVFWGNGNDWYPRIAATSDNGYIVAGGSDSNISGNKTENSQGGFDYWVLKLNNLGEIEWQNTIGGNGLDGPFSVIQTLDGGYMVGGYSISDISGDKTQNSKGGLDYWIVKINPQGIIEWQNTLGGSASERLDVVLQLSDGNYMLGGYSPSNISGDKSEDSRGDIDFWIIKHAQTLGLEENPFATAITLYPNPAKNTLHLNTLDKTINQVNIYTMTGSKVLQLDVDTVSPTVDVSNLASGVYYVQLYSGKKVALKKFVKE